ncbi:MAG: uridine diphosphate-N-acetylglucosamine-binding protein YvcK [bacterium]|nr:uridine diphosphate-N-acetylglucosamine-binding protein YvcK [bacterium]
MSLEPDPFAAALEAPRSGPNVVAVGGGTGLAQALGAIGRYAGTIHAIVTVADDGGSSGRLAPGLDIPPPGDIRQCLIALTPDDSVWRRLFEYRFAGSDVEGHSLGNLVIAALADLEGSFEDALKRAERILGAIGSVVPAAGERLHLEAVVDGVAVSGQVAITKARGHISELTVSPREAEATPRAIDALLAAEQIVLGPGSLYTSIVAALVVPEIVEAINGSDAKLVYVCNLITQDGETLGMDAADHLDALLSLTGVRPPNAIVANAIPVEIAPPLSAVIVDEDAIETYGVDVVAADLVDPAAAWPRHDPARLGGVLGRLV